MTLPALLQGRLALPVIAAPMFLVSGPDLVIAACKAGIVGAVPAGNARPEAMLDDWLKQIDEALKDDPQAAPYAVGINVHPNNTRLDEDLAACVRYRVPIVITSLRPPTEVAPAVHAYGGIVMHDVVSLRHAEKAIEAGVDGLIAVCAGAGGHTGSINPFALVAEIRQIWDGLLVLAGAIGTGQGVLGAQAMGADLAYMGTRFIATEEASASQGYKEMIVGTSAKDVLTSPFFSGIAATYLKPSVAAGGFDPDALPEGRYNGSPDDPIRPWRDIWSAGQGVGQIDDIPSVKDCVARIKADYEAAKADFLKGLIS